MSDLHPRWFVEPFCFLQKLCRDCVLIRLTAELCSDDSRVYQIDELRAKSASMLFQLYSLTMLSVNGRVNNVSNEVHFSKMSPYSKRQRSLQIYTRARLFRLVSLSSKYMKCITEVCWCERSRSQAWEGIFPSLPAGRRNFIEFALIIAFSFTWQWRLCFNALYVPKKVTFLSCYLLYRYAISLESIRVWKHVQYYTFVTSISLYRKEFEL